jgi:hypothetical protein
MTSNSKVHIRRLTHGNSPLNERKKKGTKSYVTHYLLLRGTIQYPMLQKEYELNNNIFDRDKNKPLNRF